MLYKKSFYKAISYKGYKWVAYDSYEQLHCFVRKNKDIYTEIKCREDELIVKSKVSGKTGLEILIDLKMTR
jgi:hypothetical protein